MLTLRHYRESDAASVGRLIADTYGQFNLAFASPEEQKLLLGPFQHASSEERAHQEAIAKVIRASMVFVVEEGGEIVGVLRGRKERLQSLFVRGDHHRRGIGRALVERFEQECARQGGGGGQGSVDLVRNPVLHQNGVQEDKRDPPCLEL